MTVRPFTASEITGTWATVLLPINADDSIDYARLRDEITYLNLSGVNGLYSGGTASEFYTLTEKEFYQVNEMMAELCESAGMPFQIGATHTSAQQCLDRVKTAAKLKPVAIQVILPDWFPLSDDEALAFLMRVAAAADPIGIVVYNPPHAKRVLAPESYQRLIDALPTLVGVKVGGGDVAWYDAMRRYQGRLSVFVPGHHLATGYQQGAAGSYSNVACLHPTGARNWFALMQEDIAAAITMQTRLQQFMDQCIMPFAHAGYSNQALDKLLAAIGGWANIGTRLRWPYRSISEEEVPRLRTVALDYVPELFTS